MKPKLKKIKKSASKAGKYLPKQLKKGAKNPLLKFKAAVEDAPKITNDTVAAHREEVLGSARKFIYPLQQAKHRIVIVSVAIFGAAVIAFFAYCGLELYRFQATNSFIYAVTQVIPFPVGKIGGSWVEYENYLFEIRRYIHYYQTQQQVDFNSSSGKRQLDNFKQQAMNEVEDNTYVKILAAKYKIKVTSSELNNEITLFQNQNRLGSNQQELKTVLSEFWGWSVDDFKRELSQQLLAQKVISSLDSSTHQKAQVALSALQNGADFATIAKSASDDTATKDNGGQFSSAIDKNTQNLPPQTIATLESLKPGQISGIIDVGNGLEIDKLISSSNGEMQAAHIYFSFQPLDSYLQTYRQQHKAHIFISLPKQQ